MKTRNLLIAIVAASLVVLGAWYFASPSYALSQLKDAAETGDRDDLEERIDFPKVKESLKSQLSAMMMREVEKAKDDDSNPFGAMGAMFAMAMINPMIDGIVTPDGMATLIQQGKVRKEQDAKSTLNGEPVDWTVEHDGLDSFRAIVKKGEADKPVTLVFERHGISWKLAGVVLPDQAPSASN